VLLPVGSAYKADEEEEEEPEGPMNSADDDVDDGEPLEVEDEPTAGSCRLTSFRRSRTTLALDFCRLSETLVDLASNGHCAPRGHSAPSEGDASEVR
jgi:hypothetical protein